MDMNHTSAPWQLDGPETANFTDKDYHAIRAGCGFWAGSKENREPGFSITGHMSTADARLMTAAPDLLTALQGVLRVADRQTDEFDAALAAITKATGSAA